MKKINSYNKTIIICIIIFMLISIITIYSAQTYLSSQLGNLSLKQFIFYIIGFIIISIIKKIKPEKIFHYSWYLYFGGCFLLLLLLFIGTPINNSKCWFTIPGIGSFQPSEFMKIFLILTTSKLVSDSINNKKKMTKKEELILIFKVILIFLLPAILTFLEPDTGVVIIYFIICLSILFVSGIRKSWFLIGLSIIISILSLFLFIYFFKQDIFVDLFGTNLFYRIDRILDWKNGTGFQLENSLTAIGSSGLLGHGYNKTPLYFPESGTDFIFAVFASNFGLIGSIILISIIIYFDYTLIKISKQMKKNIHQFVIIGTTCMLAFQQFQNIAMTLGIVPIMGITLPFISYGGSSLLSYFFIIGIILSMNDKKKRTIY